MASIPGVSTCTAFINAPISFAGTSGSVRLEVRPTSRIVHTASGTPLADFTEMVATAVGAVAELTLPLTDQQGFQDEAGAPVVDWVYEARIEYTLAGQTRVLPPKRFRLPAGQARIDLATVPPATGGATAATNIDGGNASTTYTTTIDGGTANG